MLIESQFGNYFKPEVKSSGRKLVAEDKANIRTHSDSLIEVGFRVSPPFTVKLSTTSIEASHIQASCRCPVASKNRFCKHIWGALIFAFEKHEDFFAHKTEINLEVEVATPKNEAIKQKAADYRKENYQRLKQKEKDKKRARKGLEAAVASSHYTEEVEAALAYFTLNGFPMPAGPSREILSEAKRTLSRVFHPDKGGSHEETVELNRNCEVIIAFSTKQLIRKCPENLSCQHLGAGLASFAGEFYEIFNIGNVLHFAGKLRDASKSNHLKTRGKRS